jgi:hypothetical protein
MQLIFIIIIGFTFELVDCASLIEYVVQMVLNTNALMVQILSKGHVFQKPKFCAFCWQIFGKNTKHHLQQKYFRGFYK